MKRPEQARSLGEAYTQVGRKLQLFSWPGQALDDELLDPEPSPEDLRPSTSRQHSEGAE